MNFSVSFCNSARSFINDSVRIGQSRLLIQNYNDANILCYIKGTQLIRPTIVPQVRNNDIIVPLMGPDVSGIARITKGEDILTQADRYIKKFLLDEKLYYAQRGYIFNNDKRPLLLVCRLQRNALANPVVSVDYSVFEDPEEPMHRFIIRKFLPYIITKKSDFSYMFANNDAFIIKPTFQNELDPKLVGEFLSSRAKYECSRLNL